MAGAAEGEGGDGEGFGGGVEGFGGEGEGGRLLKGGNGEGREEEKSG